jgi:DNA-directed RNA polymerase specialized sigma24 family protein
LKPSRYARMSDAELLARLDELVLNATRGDRQAIGAIAFAFTGDLLAEANAVLDNEHDAADVAQDFFLALLEGRVDRFEPGRRPAKAFMLGVIRAMAEQRRRERRLL